jgi:hypothetical protein
MSRQETKEHGITTEEESLVPLDPSGIVGGLIGKLIRRPFTTKKLGKTGTGYGKDSQDKAWRDLRSQN